MRPGRFTLICSSLFSFSLLFGVADAGAENRALLIGIGQYEEEHVNLPGVDRDIAMMREVAAELGFTDSQVKVLTNADATLDGIRGGIRSWLIEGTTASDRAFLYHSGHGTRIPDENSDEDDGSDEALLPYDFDEISDGDGKRLEKVLLDDELGDLLAEIPAREVVVLVDSCNSGTVTRDSGLFAKSKFYGYTGMPSGRRTSMVDTVLSTRRSSVILLGAAQEDQDAQTTADGALFTRGVYAAVTRAADARTLTLEDLQRETALAIKELIGSRRDRLHQPALYGNLELGKLNVFLAASPPLTPPKGTMSVPASSKLASWRELERLVSGGERGEITVTSVKNVYREGEALALTVTAPSDGYLNVLNVAEGEDEMVLLYPNGYVQQNRVYRGQEVRIPEPGKYRLVGRLNDDETRQLNLVAVIHTASPLNLYEAAPADKFRILARGELPPIGSYAAGLVVLTVEKDGAFEAHYERAKAERRTGHNDRALAGFEAAFEAAARDVELGRAAFQIGTLHYERGDVVEARQWLRRSLYYEDQAEVRQALRELELSQRGSVISSDEILRQLAATRSFGGAAAELRVNFEINEDALDEHGLAQAIELGEALTDAAAPRGTYLLLGHTDRQCPRFSAEDEVCDDWNHELSERRAGAVRDFLFEQFSLSSGDVRVLGCGRSHPMTFGAGNDDHYLNRRVVVMRVNGAYVDTALCRNSAGLL